MNDKKSDSWKQEKVDPWEEKYGKVNREQEEQKRQEREWNISHFTSYMPYVSEVPLSNVFYIFAAFSLVGGLFLAAVFWPESTSDTPYEETVSYMLSTIWFMVGLVEAALFTAIGKVLEYLHQIMINTTK